jgi:hypothetical protein
MLESLMLDETEIVFSTLSSSALGACPLVLLWVRPAVNVLWFRVQACWSDTRRTWAEG